jgi:molybdopterin-guanine dinucleotide biosynthesis protein A
MHGVSGVILAGGSSSRLGRNKALIEIAGQPMIERVVEQLCAAVSEIVLVTNSREQFAFLGLPMVRDIHQGIGALGGLHAGLSAIRTEYGLVVGCDMPFLDSDLLRYMISRRIGYDVVMPRIGQHYEPLHAIYAKRCLPGIEQSISSGRRRILHACVGMHIQCIESGQVALYDPHHLSFFNVNTAGDLERMNWVLRYHAQPVDATVLA